MVKGSQAPDGLPPAEVEAILTFWFDGCQHDAGRLAQRQRFWFGEGRRHDAAVKQRFGHWLAPLAELPVETLADPRACLAAILVLDQFSRHCYRGRARAFAADPQALRVLDRALQRQFQRDLHPVEAVFLYMPLQHAEDLARHDQAVQLYRQLQSAAPAPYRELLRGSLDSACEHRELIRRFGRFPHRNAVLGRVSSAAESAYLEAGGKRFGQ